MRRFWPLTVLLAAACAGEDDRITPLLVAEAGAVDAGDAEMGFDQNPVPSQPVSGTFTLNDIVGQTIMGATLELGASAGRTDARGQVHLSVPGGRSFSIFSSLSHAPPHWSEGIAPTGTFAHGIFVLTDEHLDTLFAAGSEGPPDGGGILLVEAPVGASVYADGRPGFIWGIAGPVSGDIVPSDGARLVLFPSVNAGEVDVVVQSVAGEACAALPAGAGTLRPRVHPGGVTHVAFRCP